jgi:hypothetical protein
MASTHEPRQLLEPSNLLEPLDLTEQPTDPIYPTARAEQRARSQRGFTRATGSVTPPPGGERRSPVKSVLLVAGALACFGAGTVFPQLQTLTRGNVEPEVASEGRPSAPIADVATKSDESSPVEPKSAEIKSATPISNASSAGAATATGLETNAADPNASAAAQPAQPAQPAPVAADALAGCAAPCNQQPCPKDDANCLEGAPSPAKEHTRTGGSPAKPAGAAQAVRRAAIPQAADSERAETRASARQEERAQSSRRGKRAAQRETVDHQSVARRNAATVSRWRRAEDRASNWHRDRYDDYPRDGDRRFWAARDDDFLMGRAERHEGPLMMVPSARYRW